MGSGDGLLGPAEIRSLARDLDLRPAKQRGQNFVIDPNTVRRIARQAQLRPDDVVLEIGPGLGSLTLALLPAVRAVTAVEIDPDLARQLPVTVGQRQPASADRLTVVAGDALRIPVPLPGLPPTALVANLPYNVAVPILLRMLADVPTLAHGLVMVQSEVAARLAAEPGSRAYGVPSVKLRWYADVTRAGSVAPTVFWPQPRVESGLVRFECRPQPGSPLQRAEVFRIVDAAFAQRRKTLRAALAGWAGDATAAERVLTEAGIDPAARGEMLRVQDYTAIAAARARLSRT